MLLQGVEVDLHHMLGQTLRGKEGGVNGGGRSKECLGFTMSLATLCSSLMMNIMSKRDKIVGIKSMF